MAPRTCLLAGILVAATLDIVFAMGFWLAKAGVAPARILQSVASGLLGAASYEGGAWSAALGLALHYAIMGFMVAACWLLARRFPPLPRHPLVGGIAYGLGLYAAMTWVVLPLSAASPGPRDAGWIVASVAMHCLVGVICAFAARCALGHANR